MESITGICKRLDAKNVTALAINVQAHWEANCHFATGSSPNPPNTCLILRPGLRRAAPLAGGVRELLRHCPQLRTLRLGGYPHLRAADLELAFASAAGLQQFQATRDGRWE